MSEETPPESTQEPGDRAAEPSPVPPAPPTPPPPAASPGSDPLPPSQVDVAPGGGRNAKRGLALLIAGLLVVAAGGAAFAFLQLRGSSDSLMSQVPAGADLVATVYLNPAASQKVNLFRMTDKFPVLGSESDLTQRLNTIVDQAGTSVGLNHNDFQWLGSQAAVVVDFPGAATPNVEVLINVDDVGAAKATLEKARSNPALGGSWHNTQYKGVEVSSAQAGTGAYAFVGDTLVISSTSTGVDSIIDTDQGGASLADSADFTATSDGLPDGRLAFVYVNVKSLVPLIQSAGQAAGVPAGSLDLSALEAIRGFGMTISAESNGFAMDFNESFDPAKMSDADKAVLGGAPHDNTMTNYVPSNALGLLELEHLDAIVQAGITQLEATNPSMSAELTKAGITGPDGLLSTLTGDVALEIAPGAPGLPVSGALILGINDPTKFASAVSKLKDLVGASSSCFSAVGSAIGPGVQQIPVPSPSVSSTCKPVPAPKWQTEAYKGTTINFLTDNGSPSIAYATVDGAGFIGVGPDSIKALIDAKGGQNITSSSTYTTAKDAVPSGAQFFYVDVQGVLKTVAALDGTSSGVPQAVTVLKPITAIAIGSEAGTDHVHSRFMILIP